MLKLTSTSEPAWLDLLPGVRVQVRPITVAAMLVAREAVAKVVRGEDQQDVMQHASIALVRELAQRGIVAWEGVGDAKGAPLAVTPESIDALLEVWQAYDAIDRLYVGPAMVRDQEKNGSSPAPNGTSAAARTTAAPAA